ncbi:MAG: AraC family transcriptional regulator [Pseudomonadota bacterium]
MQDFPADTLSNIVGLLRPHQCVAAGLDAGGEWAVHFERHAGMKCNAIVQGACTLCVAEADAKSAGDLGDPIHLDQGDCFILPHGRPFKISSHDAAISTDADVVYSPVPHGGTAVYNGGGTFFMTGARFLISGAAARVLVGSLPPVLVVGRGTRSEAIQWLLNRIATELRAPGLGSALMIEHLSHILLVEVIRQYLAQASAPAVGWLAALADPAIARAVGAMHADPARPWTVEALAKEAAMSRTSFAVRFRQVAGLTPVGYLTTLRMLLASDRLKQSKDSIASIAAQVGYMSESAFANAFKRQMGCSPRRHASSRGKVF